MTTVMEPMAEPKKRKPGRPEAVNKRQPVVVLKGVPEFKTWLDAFAEHCGLSLADTLGQSLIAYAEQRGFRPPPRR